MASPDITLSTSTNIDPCSRSGGGASNTSRQLRKSFFFEGTRIPDNLTDISGLWNESLNFTFQNIRLLDLTMEDAVLWLPTILEAIHPSAPFQRLILRNCEDWDRSALPFPFVDLDRLLSDFPHAKLLIAWGCSDRPPFLATFRQKLPILSSKGFVDTLYAHGPRCELPKAYISCRCELTW